MSNIASLLKTEITRLARKEVRAQTQTLKKVTFQLRADVVALKRRALALEAELKKARRERPVAETSESEEDQAKVRFSAKGLASQRRRLGLSANDCGLLLGTSGQTIYNWEEGKVRPRAHYLPGIAALRTMGKKQAAVRLAELREPAAA